MFTNVYNDDARANAYDRLEFPGTYYLAYRDLPRILLENAKGCKALDFGCGTGRSTRFLRQRGFEATGVDISEAMLARALERDPDGDYRLVTDANLNALANDCYDLIFSAFTFDNIPTLEGKIAYFGGLAGRLTSQGCIVNLVSSPEVHHKGLSGKPARADRRHRADRDVGCRRPAPGRGRALQ